MLAGSAVPLFTVQLYCLAMWSCGHAVKSEARQNEPQSVMKLLMHPWKLSMHPWKLSMHPWKLSMYPWKLSMHPLKLSMHPWKLLV